MGIRTSASLEVHDVHTLPFEPEMYLETGLAELLVHIRLLLRSDGILEPYVFRGEPWTRTMHICPRAISTKSIIAYYQGKLSHLFSYLVIRIRTLAFCFTRY